MNADGSGLRQVGRGDAQRFNPAFTPDGTRLVFVQDNGAQGGSGDIYSVSTTGSGLTRLTTSPGWDGAPDVGAHGAITWVCRSGGRPQVCTMSATGTGKVAITSTAGLTDVAHPSWSPDGSAVAFSARRTADEPEQLFRIARTGGDLRALPGEASRPAWSPDGSRIASERYVDEGVFSLSIARSGDGALLGPVVATESPWGLDPSGWQPRP
jgi:Tol biopolymer transport system component